MINEYLELNGNSSKLPCSDGVCPFSGDCEERINHKDPGLPCPRHINLMTDSEYSRSSISEYMYKDSTKLINDIDKYIDDSGRSRKFWSIELNTLQDTLSNKLVQED